MMEVRLDAFSGKVEQCGVLIDLENLDNCVRSHQQKKNAEFNCHQHIGCEPEVESAYQQLSNRKRLEAIESALQEIQSVLSKFEKRGTRVMPTEAN